MKKAILIIVMILLVGVLAYSGYKIYTITSEYAEGEDVYDEMSQYIVMPLAEEGAGAAEPGSTRAPSVPGMTGSPAGEEDGDIPDPNAAFGTVTGSVLFPDVDFTALKMVNRDVVGWIYVPGTNISYPVVQYADNKYYLYRLITKKGNGAGSIFMDYRCDPLMRDQHTILYGHHLNNGTMFAQLMNFKKQSFYDEHKVFQFLTPEKNVQAQIIAGYVASTDMDAWDLYFPEQSDEETWVSHALKRSLIKTDYVYQPGDRFITLSTCTYEFDDARYVLVGVCRDED